MFVLGSICGLLARATGIPPREVRSRTRHPERNRARLRLEGLESRCVLSITEFPLPSGGGTSLLGIASGPDGNLWCTLETGDIAMISPATDAISEFPVASGAGRIAAGPDGNIWFTDYQTNAIGLDELNTAHFVVTQQPPTSVTAGSPFSLTVQAEDGAGNLVTSFNGTVTAALLNNPGVATLGGTVSVTAFGGVATFPGLTLTKAAAGYTLQVFASGDDSAATSAFTVTPAAATQVVITRQPPSTVQVKKAFGLQASIEDPYGNVLTTANNTVSVAFANNPTGATLGGTLSVAASQGVATFSNLTISKTGSGYTLRVFSSGLSSAVSNPINVTNTYAPGVEPGPQIGHDRVIHGRRRRGDSTDRDD